MPPPSAAPALQALTDMDLAALAAAGDRRAFGELARRHVAAVRALLRRMGADAAGADDLAQDAFLVAFERMGDFRGEGPFAGWVKRIAARLYLRRRKSAWKVEDGLAEDDARWGVHPGGDAAGKVDLEDALKALAAVERVCVTLCFGAGLTHAEAAEATGLPLGTVKSHVKRGLDKLRRRMGVVAPSAPDLAGEAAHG